MCMVNFPAFLVTIPMAEYQFPWKSVTSCVYHGPHHAAAQVASQSSSPMLRRGRSSGAILVRSAWPQAVSGTCWEVVGSDA